MCHCVAHERISDPSVPEVDRDCLKDIIRAPEELDDVTGNRFAVGLLRLVFKHMSMPQFKSGCLDEVSYVLLKNGTRYNFRRVPDFNKDAAGADTILVACGEIQSTN